MGPRVISFMSKPTTNKIAFPQQITVRCPKCNSRLMDGPRATLNHVFVNGCPYEGKVFKGPVVYLEEVK
jgi:hypothetical protein